MGAERTHAQVGLAAAAAGPDTELILFSRVRGCLEVFSDDFCRATRIPERVPKKGSYRIQTVGIISRAFELKTLWFGLWGRKVPKQLVLPTQHVALHATRQTLKLRSLRQQPSSKHPNS